MLWVYASLSKLADFQKFGVQLGQSPLLTPFGKWIAFGIPSIEIILSILLAFPKWRLKGLYGSFALMALFTGYIIVITQFSQDVPCSCGGVLQHLSWVQHLWFNAFFLMLSLAGIFLQIKESYPHPKPEKRFIDK